MKCQIIMKLLKVSAGEDSCLISGFAPDSTDMLSVLVAMKQRIKVSPQARTPGKAKNEFLNLQTSYCAL
jgi:hypothetical protein